MTGISDAASRVAVVTGGGRGLGSFISEALASDGWNVTAAGRDGTRLEAFAKEMAKNGRVISVLPTDVTERADVERLVNHVEDHVGPIELLINNAGATEYGPIWESDPDRWWQVLRVNLYGPFICSRTVLSKMFRRRRGRIINISSYVANGPSAEQSAYAVSKAAVLRLTDSVAAQVADAGIRVFAVSPGLMRTDMGLEVMERRGTLDQAEWTPPQLAARLVTRIASGELDALSGRFLHATDDADGLVARLSEIESADLYQLRFRKLSDGDE